MTRAERRDALHATEIAFLHACILGHEDSLLKLFGHVEHLLTQHDEATPLRDALMRFVSTNRSIYLGPP